MIASLARKLGLVAAAGIMAASLSTGSAQAETWKCYTYIPAPTHAVFKGMVTMMERLKEASGGKIDHKCNVGGSLPIEANSIVPALADGVIDFATTGFVSGVVPVAGITGLPGLFATPEEVDAGFTAALPALSAEFEKQGVVVLGKYIYPRQVFWSKEPVKTLADLNGKTVRVTTVEQGEFVKRFNGVPVTIGTAEVATSLERGGVAVVLTAAAGGGRLWIDFLKNTSDLGPNYTLSYVLMNKDKFEALPADQQQALRKIVEEEGAAITKTLLTENNALLDDFKANKGLSITPADPAQEKLLTDTMASYWDAWAKERGEVATKLLADVRAKIGR
jgi:TRAP-type C4-dicarboxylate transport system substrate-binding protein